MTQQMKEGIARPIRGFRLPEYGQIPDVGLYLEQTAKYVSEFLEPLGDFTLTGSMISNYVKKGLIASPVKKQYGREQIAYLIFITVAKSVLSMEDLKLFIALQRRTYDTERAYDYFCLELMNLLHFVFGLKPTIDTVGVDDTDEKQMLRSTIITVAYKVYLDQCFRAMHSEE